MSLNHQKSPITPGEPPARRERSDRSDGGSPGVGQIANPEVPPTAKRRQFSDAFKLRILAEADACKKNGELGVLLRREGLYSSTLQQWRKWRNAMNKAKKRSQPTENQKLKKENERLIRQNNRLQLKLKRAEGLIDLQKKVHAILEDLTEEKNGSVS